MTDLFYSIYSRTYFDWAPLVLRIGLGVIFIIHGWPKIKNPRNFANWLSTLGIKPALFWALVVAVVEFFGGIVLIVGYLVPLVAFLIAINMLVAIVKVKRKFVGGWEFDLALLIMAISLIFLTYYGWRLIVY